MMLATSHSSAQSGSNMSQNSVSPLHSSGPLTPPESGSGLGGMPMQSPATPPTHGRSPRAVRKSTRPSVSPMAYPQPGSYDHMLPQSMSPANLMPPPSSYTPGQSFGSTAHGLMASPMGYPSPLGTASPSQFTSYTGSFPSSGYFPSQPMSYSLSQQSGHSARPLQSDTEAEAEGETDFESLSFAVDLDLDLESGKPTTSKAAPASKSPKSVVSIPRPANAWILYRSDRLKDISAGRKIKGLDEVMRESGYSASSASASSGDESGLDRMAQTTPATSASVTDDDQSKPKVKKVRKAKKGAKEPTEGLLSLGRGKTGRGLPQAHISKMISILWKRESAEVRSKYEQLSEQRKQEHAEKYPDYKYQPMRRADKIRIKELKDMEKEKEKEVQKQEKQREREVRRAATRERGTQAQKPRHRPSTAPYDHESRQGLSRSKSAQTLHQQYGSPQKPRRSAAPSSRIDPGQLYEAQPFPFSIGYQPMAPTEHEPYQMPYASSSAEHSRLQSRQHSPSKQSTPQLPPPPAPPLYHPQPQPYSMQGVPQEHPPIDPSLFGQYAQQPMPAQPYVQPGQPFYADMTGLGPVYAQPVVFEPQSLPDSVGLEQLFPMYENGQQSAEEELIQQWVVMEEMEEANGDAALTWLQDPDAAASDWANLSSDTQEQFFHDLDLSHAMAVQLVPGIGNGMTPFNFSTDGLMPDQAQPTVDYSAGYLNMPFFTDQGIDQTLLEPSPQMESGPFLSVQQPLSPDPRDITPRQSHFAHNMLNTVDGVEFGHPITRIASSSSLNQNPMLQSRYVSASAFPDTPLSVDPSGLGGDRQTNYTPGGLEWQNDSETGVDLDGSQIKSGRTSPTKLDMPLSPLDEDNLSFTPSSVGSPTKPGAGAGAGPGAPKGNNRRARSVASSFT